MEQSTTSNGKQRFLIIGILVLVGLGLFYSYWSRSSVSKLSELDRVATAMVDVWCFNLRASNTVAIQEPRTSNKLESRFSEHLTFSEYKGELPQPKGDGLESTLNSNTENEKELENIFKKYGFKSAEEFEKTGEKYKGSDELAQKTVNSEKYIECTQGALSNK